jgi:tRNA pseudouridine55 synthase
MQINLLETNFNEGAMLLIDKPLEWTSFQLVNKIKYLLGKPKIGHSGTLDPLATGLLILCTGKWTKKLTELTGLPKVYTGIITIGATTPTYDLESEPENIQKFSHITEQQILDCALTFLGEQLQTPPVFSAIKQAGKPIYLKARQGLDVEIKPRSITISAFNILKIEGANVHFEIACTSGTYIRTIANDFGNKLACGAYLRSLRRTQIGDYHINDAHTLQSYLEIFDKGASEKIKQTNWEPKKIKNFGAE